jgi:ferredoxin
MQTDLLQEARRQAEICNACRYCEGYCSVFPALHAERAFSDGDLTQLANLCHNCRGCYYACQYTAPHEFDLNLPQALANVRQDSWEDLAFPQAAGRAFQKNGVAIAVATVIGFALLFWRHARWLRRAAKASMPCCRTTRWWRSSCPPSSFRWSASRSACAVTGSGSAPGRSGLHIWSRLLSRLPT